MHTLYLRSLKCGVLRGVKDPCKGKLAFRSSNTRVAVTATVVSEETSKRKAKEVEEFVIGLVEELCWGIT